MTTAAPRHPGGIWGFPGSGRGRPLATIALVKPIAYALQFRGVAAVDASGLVSARATAPGGALRTFVESDGVRGGYEPDAGDEAVLQARIALGHDGSFTAV